MQRPKGQKLRGMGAVLSRPDHDTTLLGRMKRSPLGVYPSWQRQLELLAPWQKMSFVAIPHQLGLFQSQSLLTPARPTQPPTSNQPASMPPIHLRLPVQPLHPMPPDTISNSSLLVISTNLHPILHHFQIIAGCHIFALDRGIISLTHLLGRQTSKFRTTKSDVKKVEET